MLVYVSTLSLSSSSFAHLLLEHPSPPASDLPIALSHPQSQRTSTIPHLDEASVLLKQSQTLPPSQSPQLSNEINCRRLGLFPTNEGPTIAHTTDGIIFHILHPTHNPLSALEDLLHSQIASPQVE